MKLARYSVCVLLGNGRDAMRYVEEAGTRWLNQNKPEATCNLCGGKRYFPHVSHVTITLSLSIPSDLEISWSKKNDIERPSPSFPRLLPFDHHLPPPVGRIKGPSFSLALGSPPLSVDAGSNHGRVSQGNWRDQGRPAKGRYPRPHH